MSPPQFHHAMPPTSERPVAPMLTMTGPPDTYSTCVCMYHHSAMEPRRPLLRTSSYLSRKLPSPATSSSQFHLSPLLEGLNHAQRTAVSTPASVIQILAPPGSGKTRTLTSRVAYLVTESEHLAPENVVVATFTVKAAREMKERLSKLVGDDISRQLVMGTFHSITRRYLIKYGYLIGLKSGWGIADTADTKAICQVNSIPASVVRIIKRRGLGDIIDPKQLHSRISYFKARNILPQANSKPVYNFTQGSSQLTQKKEKDIANEEFIALYEDYHIALESSNLLDYDDLLLRCLDLLKLHPECVSNIEAVLIDEFQDTNIVQYELMRHFAWKKRRITIVGDPDQSIYGFRAAEIGNLRKMRTAYPETLVVNLEENYRSSASILTAAMEVIKQDHGRHDKPLMATHAVGPSPVLRRVPTPAMEATWIASEIRRVKAYMAGRISFDGFAILVRSSPLTRSIEIALSKNGIPYKMVGGTRFFDRSEVKIVLDYMRVLQNPSNNDALARILNVPPRKIGDTTMKIMLEETERTKRTLWDYINKSVRGDISWGTKVTAQQEASLGVLTALLKDTMKRLDAEDSVNVLADIIDGLLIKLKYKEYLQRMYPEDVDSRLANVVEALSQAKQLPIEDDESLPELEGVTQAESSKNARFMLERFLANVALVNERREEESNEQGQVTISTIHAAKVYEGSIPHSRAEDTDEERRLLYVAMTRAQALLYMTCPFKGPTQEKTKLSSFIDELKVHRLLAKRASDFTFSNVQIIANILSIPCPTEPEIETSIEAANLVSRTDDQISDKDPADDEKGDKKERQYRNEARLYDETASGYSGYAAFQSALGWNNGGAFMTTEEQLRMGAGLNNGAAVMTTEEQLRMKEKLGFQSASKHLIDLREQGNVNCQAENLAKRKRAFHERQSYHEKIGSVVVNQNTVSITRTDTSSATFAASSVSSTKRKKTTTVTGNPKITKFFTKKPSVPLAPTTSKPSRPETATDVFRNNTTNGNSLMEQMQSLPAPIIPKRTQNEFIIFSSSPPQKSPPSKHPRSSNNRHIVNHPISRITRMSSRNDSETQDPFRLEDTATGTDDDYMLPDPPPPTPPQVVSSAAPPRGIDNRQAVKRTLGIRRSMNGWANRANK
ncbi:UvrD-helicase-domain-containing protein [Ascodesmis nigricans]|uniref:DNA 3'-5' helicase n=1 Tax=Ascodesmis nigricans TaxID=341454 RepID=A0A4S2MYQ7_9PEZI|nr:UvrD-helicase-domain-containing protein [Ascodesmis nigricans]